MRFQGLATALLLTCTAIAAPITIATRQAPFKQIIVSYPKGTPSSVVEQAMDAIKDAGGMVTHEYKLIVGFAAKASSKVLDTISIMGADHGVVVEEDQMVSINGPS